jgi:3D (Asp-Asp-Asp) domain-containing protein
MNIKRVRHNLRREFLQARRMVMLYSYEYVHLFLLLTFTTFSAFPTPVLAYSNQTAAMQHGLQFQVPVGQLQTLLFVNGVRKQPSEVVFAPGMLVSVWASAYSSTEAQTDSDPYTTAWGTHVRPGIIAANFLPLGTKVKINGQEYTVEDRLNSRYNNEYMIDLWMGSTAEALQFGIRLVTFEIVFIP